MTTSGLGLSIAVLAFGASTIYLAVQLNKERAHAQQLVDETRALNTRITELEKARAEPPLARSGTFGMFSAVDTPPGKTVSASPPAQGGRNEAQPHSLQAVAVNGPSMHPHGEAFRKMIRSQMRAQNKQTYADVTTELGLSKEDASKLIDLLTDQVTDGMTISRDTTDPTEQMRLMNEARRENEAKIAELLGPEKLRLLEQYQQTIPVRQQVEMLVRQLDGSDAAPLSESQRKRLLAAFIEERKRIPEPDYRRGNTGEDFRTAYLNWQDDYNARVATQARSILDVEQYAAYDDYQKWQKEMSDQMARVLPPGPGGNVMYSTATGTMVGEAAVMTLVTPEEKPARKP